MSSTPDWLPTFGLRGPVKANTWELVDANGEHIAAVNVRGKSDESDSAVCSLIARDLNAVPKLVEALGNLINEYLDDATEDGEYRREELEDRDAIVAARSALALLEAKP